MHPLPAPFTRTLARITSTPSAALLPVQQMCGERRVYDHCMCNGWQPLRRPSELALGQRRWHMLKTPKRPSSTPHFAKKGRTAPDHHCQKNKNQVLEAAGCSITSSNFIASPPKPHLFKPVLWQRFMRPSEDVAAASRLAAGCILEAAGRWNTVNETPTFWALRRDRTAKSASHRWASLPLIAAPAQTALAAPRRCSHMFAATRTRCHSLRAATKSTFKPNEKPRCLSTNCHSKRWSPHLDASELWRLQTARHTTTREQLQLADRCLRHVSQLARVFARPNGVAKASR